MNTFARLIQDRKSVVAEWFRVGIEAGVALSLSLLIWSFDKGQISWGN